MPVAQTRLLVLHTLRLKGFADDDVLAARTGLATRTLQKELRTLSDETLVVRREGRLTGWSLTEAGRAADARLVADEVEAAGCRVALDEGYGRFLDLNLAMLAICTDWQL